MKTPHHTRRRIRTIVVGLVAAMVPLVAAVQPASADTPRCVSANEFHYVTSHWVKVNDTYLGWRRTRIEGVFDTRGYISWRNAQGTRLNKQYRACANGNGVQGIRIYYVSYGGRWRMNGYSTY